MTAGDRARVACLSRRDCARCAAGRGCGAAYFARLLGAQPTEIDAGCPDGLPETGERVVLELSEPALLEAAALAYLAPLAGLVVGATLGAMSGAGEAAAMFGAVAGVALGWGGAALYARGRADKLRPVVRRR